MKRFSLRALLIAFVAVTLLLAWFREPIIKAIKTSRVQWKLVESRRDFERMLDNEYSFVFVDADWSMTAKVGRMSVDEFMVDWNWYGRKPEMTFYLIDSTADVPDGFQEWAETHQRSMAVFGGNGEAIWLKKGSVLEWISGGHRIQHTDLLDKTRELFPN